MRAIMGYLLRTIHNISKTPNSLQLLMYVFALFLSPPPASLFFLLVVPKIYFISL